MGSPQHAETTTGVGAEVYRWLLASLSFSRVRARGYRRLNATPARKRVRLARLGGRTTTTTVTTTRSGLRIRRRMPRLRLRLRLSWFSPLTLLAKLRDTYVSLLQAASSKMAITEGLAAFPGFPCDLGPSTLQPGPPPRSLTAQERELDRVLSIYLARARSQLLLTDSENA